MELKSKNLRTVACRDESLVKIGSYRRSGVRGNDNQIGAAAFYLQKNKLKTRKAVQLRTILPLKVSYSISRQRGLPMEDSNIVSEVSDN